MKSRHNLQDTMVSVLSSLFILLFVYAAGSKWRDFDLFLAQVGQSPILTNWAHLIVLAIPTIEIVIAVLLAIRKWRTVGLYAFYTMMVMFSAYIYIIMYHAKFVPCSCGGILSKMTWRTHLEFNIIVVVLSAIAILCSPKRIATKLVS